MHVTEFAPRAPAAQALNINEASKACGLSPSVLRIWELRYGWPSPRRRGNGYRAYMPNQVQDLIRVATLVRSGKAISELIVDGLPSWPAGEVVVQTPRGLPKTKELPRMHQPAARKIQETIIDALEMRHVQAVRECMQFAILQLRPDDEPVSVLVPVIHGIAEARANGRPFAEETELLQAVRSRIEQLSRAMKQPPGATAVVPLSDGQDHVLAQLVALMLNQRCQLAVYSGTKPARPKRWIAVGEGASPGALGRMSIFGGEGQCSLAALSDVSTAPPWAVALH
ncbi:MAG: MerR family transcriptional regulator [Planctomycetota bacterium]